MKASTNEPTRYVGLDAPVELRRTILQGSRGILRNLQLYEDLKELERQRIDISQVFTKELKEIRSLMRKLKKQLPKVHIEKLKKIEVKKKEAGNLADLERELDAIEQGL